MIVDKKPMTYHEALAIVLTVIIATALTTISLSGLALLFQADTSTILGLDLFLSLYSLSSI